MKKCTLFCCFLLSLAVVATAQPLNQVQPLSEAVSSYVSVLTPETAEFMRVLPTLVSPEVVTGLAPAFPYSVLIKNVSNEELRGVNVVFAEIGKTGAPKHRQSYASIMLDPAHHTHKPGEYRLFLASNVLNTAAQMRKLSLPAGVSVSSIVAELQQAPPLIVSVEWVVNAKNQVIGPDAYHLFDKLQAQQQARAALAKSLTSSADPIGTLGAIAKIQPRPPCLASITFSGPRQLFFPINDN